MIMDGSLMVNVLALMISLIMLSIIFYLVGFISLTFKRIALVILRYFVVPSFSVVIILSLLFSIADNFHVYLLASDSIAVLMILAFIIIKVLRVNLLPWVLKRTSISRKRLVVFILCLLIFIATIYLSLPNKAGAMVPEKIIKAKYFEGLIYGQTNWGIVVIDREYDIISYIPIEEEILDFIPYEYGVIYITGDSIKLVDFNGEILWTIDHYGYLLDYIITPNYLITLLEDNIVVVFFLSDGSLFNFINMTDYGINASLVRMKLSGKYLFFAGFRDNDTIIIKFDAENLEIVADLTINDTLPVFMDIGEYLFLVTNPKPLEGDVFSSSEEGFVVDVISPKTLEHVKSIPLPKSSKDVMLGGYAGEEAFVVYTTRNAYAILYQNLELLSKTVFEDIINAFFVKGSFCIITYNDIYITGITEKKILLPMRIRGGLIISGNLLVYGVLYEYPTTGFFLIKPSGDIISDFVIERKIETLNTLIVIITTFSYMLYLLIVVRDIPASLKKDLIKRLEEELLKPL